MNPNKLVLKPEARRQVMEAWTNDLELEVVREVDRAHTVMSWKEWIDPHGRTITWMEDHTMGVVFVEGDLIDDDLRGRLPHFTQDELVAGANGDDPVVGIRSLRALAEMTRYENEGEPIDMFERWVSHEDEAVRRAAARCLWVGRWPGALEVLRLRREKDVELREALDHMIASLSE